MNLYLIKTVKGYSSYVLAEDLNTAWEKFSKLIEKDNYGTFDERKLGEITVVADTKTYGYPYESRHEIMKLIM